MCTPCCISQVSNNTPLCVLCRLWAKLQARSAVVAFCLLLLSRSAEWRLLMSCWFLTHMPATLFYSSSGNVMNPSLRWLDDFTVGALKAVGRQREEATSHNVSQQREQHSSYLLSGVPSSDVQMSVQMCWPETGKHCWMTLLRGVLSAKLLGLVTWLLAVTNINAHLFKHSGTSPPSSSKTLGQSYFLLTPCVTRVIMSWFHFLCLWSVKGKDNKLYGNGRLLSAHLATLVVSLPPRKKIVWPTFMFVSTVIVIRFKVQNGFW